jgi:hypothetical protein
LHQTFKLKNAADETGYHPLKEICPLAITAGEQTSVNAMYTSTEAAPLSDSTKGLQYITADGTPS